MGVGERDGWGLERVTGVGGGGREGRVGVGERDGWGGGGRGTGEGGERDGWEWERGTGEGGLGERDGGGRGMDGREGLVKGGGGGWRE